ncbi:hypothetical protein [Roseateles sp. LYH14W]|uniref:Uncharacterized protein n=1 Tax=Pelomonas parva TaxID=3299032 RepID=A0ABW7F4L9_9BURK
MTPPNLRWWGPHKRPPGRLPNGLRAVSYGPVNGSYRLGALGRRRLPSWRGFR